MRLCCITTGVQIDCRIPNLWPSVHTCMGLSQQCKQRHALRLKFFTNDP